MARIGQSSDWVAVLTAKAILTAKQDARFSLVLALGRVTNTLTLARLPIQRPLRWQSPRIRRERQAALLYAGAVLFEGMRLVEGLARHYCKHAKWATTFKPLLADPTVRSLRTEFLRPLRNKGVFHFDADLFADALTRVPAEEIIIASGRGFTVRDLYIDASDDLILLSLLGSPARGQHEARLEQFIVGTMDLYARFTRAATAFLAVAIAELGARRRRPRSTDPAIRMRDAAR